MSVPFRQQLRTWMVLAVNPVGLGFCEHIYSVHMVKTPQLIPPTSILEGLVTVIAGLISFWVIQDFPHEAKFLSEAERTVVVRRLQQDDQFSAAGEKLKPKYIWQSIADWKTWISSKIPLFA
jgi:hypothetical protein